jgi:hypothetical protein
MMHIRSVAAPALLALSLFARPSHAQDGHGDLSHAQYVCSTAPLAIPSLPGPGQDAGELSLAPCFPATAAETNSHWLRWRAANDGLLHFSIVPLQPGQDLDFVLFRLGGDGPTPLRCMASGRRLGELVPDDLHCLGATGLRPAPGPLESAPPGCPPGADAFLDGLVLEPGAEYALLLHNHRAAGGAMIEFGGTAQFEPAGPGCAEVPSVDVPGLWLGQATFEQARPNPARDRVLVGVSLPEAVQGGWQLVDVRGRPLRNGDLRLAEGQHTLSVPLDGVPPGPVFLKVVLGDSAYLARIVVF